MREQHTGPECARITAQSKPGSHAFQGVVDHVSDLDIAARQLGLEEFRAPGLAISLIPFDGMSERGSRCDGAGNSWAAPLQVLMDCYAGIDRMPDLADALANRWDAEAWP